MGTKWVLHTHKTVELRSLQFIFDLAFGWVRNIDFQLSSLCKPFEAKFQVSLLSRVGDWVVGWGGIEIKAKSA